MKNRSSLYLSASLLALAFNISTATTSLWDGAQTGDWGAATGWVVDGTTTPNGIPNGVDDVAMFDNNSFYAGWGSISLETEAGADLNVTVGEWRQILASTSGRHVDVRTSGSATLTFDVSSGDAVINHQAGSSTSGLTFQVGVQLNDDLVVNTSGVTSTGYREGITFNNVVLGDQSIAKNGVGSLSFEGTGANTFSGGLAVNNGLVQGMKTGAFGTGDIHVEQSAIDSTAALEITTGVIDAISDSASLYLGSFDDGSTNFSTITLAAGVSEAIGGLYFDTVLQATGTWGATGSGATNINDDWFSGTGVLTVVPELGTYGLLLGIFAFARIAMKRRVR